MLNLKLNTLVIALVVCGISLVNCTVANSTQSGYEKFTARQSFHSLVFDSATNPEELLSIIKRKQESYVRKSYNETDCFTDNDLENFKASKIPTKIVSQLQKDQRFLKVIAAIKNLSSNEKNELFEKALNTYSNTWSQNGRIDETGQTEAGQEAQILICKAIVNLSKKLVDEE